MTDFTSLLSRSMEGVAPVPADVAAKLAVHYDSLLRWNKKLSLTSIRSPLELVERHYAESLFLAGSLPESSIKVADIGSGPGFPGVPVAAALGSATVSLVESNSRKCVFLREAARHLPNVEVAEIRGAQLAGQFDWIVSRAVRWQDVREVVLQNGSHAALLIGESDLKAVTSSAAEIAWDQPRKLPWGDRRFLLVGHVSRGT